MNQRKQNVVLFCASKSIDNKNAGTVKSILERNNCNCIIYEQLFAKAPDKPYSVDERRAILPMLIKKIPTFDFAIILSDGLDELKEIRGKTPTEKRIMRDNVLFECGLCITALGPERVILLIDEEARVPDDLRIPDHLMGVKMGIKKIAYSNRPDGANGPLYENMKEVIDHIAKEAANISPIVIGAAISTADGYFSNFILRFWENIRNEEGESNLSDFGTMAIIDAPDPSQIRMNIYIPNEIEQGMNKAIWDYYEKNGYKRGIIPTGQCRGVEFRYRRTEDELIICDIPSAITASHNTVKDILNLNADDYPDDDAERRFLMKELDSFRFTLNRLMTDRALVSKLSMLPYYTDRKKIDEMIKFMKQVNIESINTMELKRT